MIQPSCFSPHLRGRSSKLITGHPSSWDRSQCPCMGAGGREEPQHLQNPKDQPPPFMAGGTGSSLGCTKGGWRVRLTLHLLSWKDSLQDPGFLLQARSSERSAIKQGLRATKLMANFAVPDTSSCGIILLKNSNPFSATGIKLNDLNPLSILQDLQLLPSRKHQGRGTSLFQSN